MVARPRRSRRASRRRAVRRLERARVAGADGLRDRLPARRRRSQPGAPTRRARPAAGRRQRRHASCAAPRPSAFARCSRSRARRRCGRPRCCAPAWARISACGWSRALEPTTRRRCAVPVIATSSHDGEWLHETAAAVAARLGVGPRRAGRRADARAAACRCACALPQPGGEESLNVAAAAAICLYERRASAEPSFPGAADRRQAAERCIRTLPPLAVGPSGAGSAATVGRSILSRSAGRAGCRCRIVVAISSIDLCVDDSQRDAFAPHHRLGLAHLVAAVLERRVLAVRPPLVADLAQPLRVDRQAEALALQCGTSDDGSLPRSKSSGISG